MVSVKEIWIPSEADNAGVGGKEDVLGVEDEGGGTDSSIEAISLLRASYNPTFFFFPSCMPLPFIAAAGLASGKYGTEGHFLAVSDL